MIDPQDTGFLYDWALEWMMGYPSNKLELTVEMDKFLSASGYNVFEVKGYLKNIRHFVQSMDNCFNLLECEK